MKVLFISRLFYPHIGGVEKHVLELSKALVSKGHEITVITEQYNNKLKRKDTLGKIQIYRVPNLKSERLKKFAIWYWLFNNLDLISRADVIHIHDVYFWYLPFRFIFFSKKNYITFHGYEGDKIPGIKSKIMHKLADWLASGSISVGSFYKKWYGTKSDIVTYGAIGEIISIQTEKNSFKNNTLKIVYLGRLEPEAGIMDYLKILKNLESFGYKVHLDVLGDGSEKNQAINYSKQNNLSVTFYGFVKNIDNHIQGSDLVFTSRYLGIMEALSHKKFVLALFNNKIKHDYLVMTPFKEYISIFSVKSLKSTDRIISYILDPNKFTKSLDRSYTWASLQTWDKLAESYARLWRVI